MRNSFAAIELRANDNSSVNRKSLRGQAIGQIGCFARGGVPVCAILAHQAIAGPTGTRSFNNVYHARIAGLYNENCHDFCPPMRPMAT